MAKSTKGVRAVYTRVIKKPCLLFIQSNKQTQVVRKTKGLKNNEDETILFFIVELITAGGYFLKGC